LRLALARQVLTEAAHGAETDKARKLVGRLDETLSAMSGMLNALLDINQIEAGTVHAEIANFPISELFDQ
jgi:two-component system CheB/CheR fusion protein